MKESFTYADAGVDIDKANKLVDAVGKIAKQTARAGVMSDIGGFGGLFSLNLANLEGPVLVSSTDGVGTKLKIAFMLDKHDTVGIDLVAMCVNDIIVQGAKPLFFLDYLSMGKLDNQRATDIITGIARGCKQAKCALLGGETAEMPGFYAHNEYDLAGFTVGVVDNSKIIDGTGIRVGHKLVGIASSGLHSNGYSLVRKVCFEVLNLKIDQHVTELGKTIGEELLTPTKIYVKALLPLIDQFTLDGLAHITGGGISENIIRVIPDDLGLEIDLSAWDFPTVFKWLQSNGQIDESEMLRTFNCGIGMVILVGEDSVNEVSQALIMAGEKVCQLGRVVEYDEGGQNRNGSRVTYTRS